MTENVRVVLYIYREQNRVADHLPKIDMEHGGGMVVVHKPSGDALWLVHESMMGYHQARMCAESSIVFPSKVSSSSSSTLIEKNVTLV